MQTNYKQKYLKYKKKYLDLKNHNLKGGDLRKFLFEDIPKFFYMFLTGSFKAINQAPKGLASAGQAIANTSYRNYICDKNDSTKNNIINNIKGILDLLKTDIHKRMFLVILNNTKTDTLHEYKSNMSLLIQVFQSIKDKKIQKDYTSYDSYENIEDIARRIMYNPTETKKNIDLITVPIFSNFEEKVGPFLDKIGKDNIETIIKYLKEIRDQIDCYCNDGPNNIKKCKVFFNEYEEKLLENPVQTTIQTLVQPENNKKL